MQIGEKVTKFEITYPSLTCIWQIFFYSLDYISQMYW